MVTWFVLMALMPNQFKDTECFDSFIEQLGDFTVDFSFNVIAKFR